MIEQFGLNKCLNYEQALSLAIKKILLKPVADDFRR